MIMDNSEIRKKENHQKMFNSNKLIKLKDFSNFFISKARLVFT